MFLICSGCFEVLWLVGLVMLLGDVVYVMMLVGGLGVNIVFVDVVVLVELMLDVDCGVFFILNVLVQYQLDMCERVWYVVDIFN